MTDTKKKWVKPELTVLLRSKPEEAVLQACKDISSGSGINGKFGGCGETVCFLCVAEGQS